MLGLETDPTEIAAAATSFCGAWFTTYALTRALRIWREAAAADSPIAHLGGVAMRRVRQQAFHLLFQGVIVAVCTVALWLPLGDIQAALRNNALLILSMMLLFRSAIEHWEQRTLDNRPWTGRERRHEPK